VGSPRLVIGPIRTHEACRPARLIVTKNDHHPTHMACLGKSSWQFECSAIGWLKRLNADNSVHIQRPIYVRIKLTVARVLVSNFRNDAFRINDKQNKTALAPKQGVGDLADLIGG
jgi:hypothetical protein